MDFRAKSTLCAHILYHIKPWFSSTFLGNIAQKIAFPNEHNDGENRRVLEGDNTHG